MKGAGKIWVYCLKTRRKISSVFKHIKSHHSEDDNKFSVFAELEGEEIAQIWGLMDSVYLK